MSVILIGEFRLPVDNLDAARPAIDKVVSQTRAEHGCLHYAYAADLFDPGLIRISEKWSSADALTAHMKAPHMEEWKRAREELGMTGRTVTMYEVASEKAV